ncbi:hypothetical protein YM3MPS_43580 [Mycobacterium pseudoshottsii]|nr:hypothetical protein YM3MPS_43580 [Mycobacterium pseudoshottsii]
MGVVKELAHYRLAMIDISSLAIFPAGSSSRACCTRK